MCLAVPGRIESISEGGDRAAPDSARAAGAAAAAAAPDPLFRQARVSFGGVIKTISLACVPEATVGDHVLVHAGIAIATIDEQAARETLALLAEIAALDDEAAGGGEAADEDEAAGGSESEP